jgi:hypothetical protein
MSMINHEMKKIKAGDGGDHQPEEVAAEFRSNPISHKEILNAEQEIYVPQHPLSP